MDCPSKKAMADRTITTPTTGAVMSRGLPEASRSAGGASLLPLRLFCKEPIHNFHIAMHLLGSMNLFSDLTAVLK